MHRYKYSRLGIIATAVSALSLALLVLCVYPRYLMEDFFHVMQWGPVSGWVPGGAVIALITSTLIAYIAMQRSRSRSVDFATAGLIVIVFLIAISIGFPMLAKAPESHRFRRNHCRARERMLATTMLMYAQDHHMRLPERWDEVEVYGATADMRTCPETQRYFHRLGGYGYNAHLRGKTLDEIDDPGSMLLIADAIRPTSYMTSASDIDRTRHHGERFRGFFGAFLDGHAEFFPADAKVRLE